MPLAASVISAWSAILFPQSCCTAYYPPLVPLHAHDSSSQGHSDPHLGSGVTLCGPSFSSHHQHGSRTSGSTALLAIPTRQQGVLVLRSSAHLKPISRKLSYLT